MKIILKEDVAGLGNREQIVNVKDGYARNYLIPRGLALVATESNIKIVKEESKWKLKKEEKDKIHAENLAEKLNKLEKIEIKVKVGANDKLYGSVTSHDIAEQLSKLGYSVDKKKIVISEPIKQLGISNVTLNLFKNVNVNLKVEVLKEE